MKQSTNATYHEEQYFRSPWLWLVVGLVAALQWWAFVQQIVLGKPWGTNPAPDWMLIIFWILFGIGLPWLFLSVKLAVTVSSDAVHIRFRPFINRSIAMSDIVKVESRTYSPLREYGGWGIRFARHGKRAYNVSGNQGVELTLADGRKVLIGTQRPDELASAIEAAR